MKETPNNQAESLERGKFIEQLKDRLLILNDKLDIESMDANENPPNSKEYEMKTNETLLKDIAGGDISATAIQQVVIRMEMNGLKPEDFCIILDDPAKFSLEKQTVTLIIKKLLQKGLNQMAMFPGMRSIMTKNLILKHPEQADLVKKLGDLIELKIVSEDEFRQMSENQNLENIIDSAVSKSGSSMEDRMTIPESLDDIIKRRLLTKLEEIGNILSFGRTASIEEIKQSKLIKLDDDSLCKYLINVNTSNFSVAIALLILRLKNGNMSINRIVSKAEKGIFSLEQNELDIAFLNDLVLLRLVRAVAEINKLDEQYKEGAKKQVIRAIKMLINKRLISVYAIKGNKAILGSLKQVLKEAYDYIDWDTEIESRKKKISTFEPTLDTPAPMPVSMSIEYEKPGSEPDMRKALPPPPMDEPESKKKPGLSEGQPPVDAQKETPAPPVSDKKPQRNLTDKGLFASVGEKAGEHKSGRKIVKPPVKKREPVRDSSPEIIRTETGAQTRAEIETAPTVPEMPSMAPPPAQLSLEEKRKQKDVMIFPSEQAGQNTGEAPESETDYERRKSIARESIRPIPMIHEHPEGEGKLIMPLAHVLINGVARTLPLFSTRTCDDEGYYVFSIGTDKLSDIQISSEDNRRLYKKHALVRIRQNTVQINSARGVTRLKGSKDNIKTWTDLKPDQEFEVGGGEDFISIKIEAPGEIYKSEIKEVIYERLKLLQKERTKIIENFNDATRLRSTDPPTRWEVLEQILNEMENFETQYKIDIQVDEKYRSLRRVSEEPREEFKKREMLKLERKAKESSVAQIIREHDEKERIRKSRERRQAIDARAEKEGFKYLYIADGEDPDKAEVIKESFWVLETLDPDDKGKPQIKPMLTPSRTYGTHEANTDELKNSERITRGPQFTIDEFMAEIAKDPNDLDTLVFKAITSTDPSGRKDKISIKYAGGEGKWAPLPSKEFKIKPGDTVRIGRYHLHVVGNSHGYTAKAMLPHAKNMIDEAIERIFEVERTTAIHDKQDHRNIQRILEYNLPKLDQGITLREYTATRYKEEFQKLWNKVKSFKPENPEFNAKIFPTLELLLDLCQEAGAFINDYEITYDDLVQQAATRVNRYIMAGDVAYPDKDYHPVKAIKKFFTNPSKEIREQEKEIADRGAIEIARFVQELGYFPEDEIYEKASTGYAKKIREIIIIREGFDKLEEKDADIAEILGVLLLMCENKSMSEVFSDEETAIMNMDPELKLDPQSSIKDFYISKKALFAARKAYRKAMGIFEKFDAEKDSPEELKAQLEILRKILNMQLFNHQQLYDDTLDTKSEQEIKEYVSDMEKQVRKAEIRIRRHAEEKALREKLMTEHAKRLHELTLARLQHESEQKELKFKADMKYEEHLHTQIKHLTVEVAKVRKCLAGAKKSIDAFEDMMDTSDIVKNREIDKLAHKFEIKVQGAVYEIRQQKEDKQERDSSVKRAEIASTQVEPFTQTWEDLKDEWWQKFNEVAGYVAGLIEKGDRNAVYYMGLIKESISKGYTTYEKIGVTGEQLLKGLDKLATEKRMKEMLVKMDEYRGEILKLDDDDFDYLDEDPFFEKESNEAVRAKLYDLRGELTAHRIHKCLDYMREGDRPVYFLNVAREAAVKDPEATNHLSEEDFDLLQQE